MMIMLGLDSQYAYVEVVVTGITDEWPHLRQKKPWILLACCTIGFLIGLPMTSPGGVFLFNLIDHEAASIGFLICALMLLIAIYHVYGNRATRKNRFNDDVKMMIGQGISKIYKLMFSFITPIIILAIAISSCMS